MNPGEGGGALCCQSLAGCCEVGAARDAFSKRFAGQPFFTTEMLWIADRTLPGWDYADGWNIRIRGAPGIDVRIDLVEPVNMRDRSKAMQYAVAGPVVRAIPEVIKAPPGILLPPVFAAWSPRI